MNVLALTILISVCLAAIFIVCFIGELRKPHKRGIEHQALMPLEDDAPAPSPTEDPSKI
ncbi:MAG: hypothetical protein KJO21_05745 [Verrucomicrobiae bacterium]|nr:hypothetical protein [Verrucomicrobiae bacterium]NNJ43225.1 hypothetical protein [Akkermansiaceae bacterium]